METSETIKGYDKTKTNVYGRIDLFMGPGDEYSLQNILVMYDPVNKVQFVAWHGTESTISKSLFDRDLAPVCYSAIARTKETFGKLESGIIYLVTEKEVSKCS